MVVVVRWMSAISLQGHMMCLYKVKKKWQTFCDPLNEKSKIMLPISCWNNH
jgi:hypothetical protein